MISRRKLAEHAANRLLKGDAPSDVLNEIAAFLIDTKRTNESDLVVRAVEDALLTRGVALVTVTSARELSDGARSDIEQLVRSEYDGISSVLLREIIDSSVLAGVKISLSDAQLDTTAKAKLEKLGV